HLFLFRRWVDEGKPVDARDNTQKTPLHYAAQWGQEETLDFLIECGANVNAPDFIEDTPLHFACYFGHANCARILIMVGANVGAQDCYGNTPSQIFDDHVTEPVLDEIRFMVREVVRGQQQLAAAAGSATPTRSIRLPDARSSGSLCLGPTSPLPSPTHAQGGGGGGVGRRVTDPSYEPSASEVSGSAFGDNTQSLSDAAAARNGGGARTGNADSGAPGGGGGGGGRLGGAEVLYTPRDGRGGGLQPQSSQYLENHQQQQQQQQQWQRQKQQAGGGVGSSSSSSTADGRGGNAAAATMERPTAPSRLPTESDSSGPLQAGTVAAADEQPLAPRLNLNFPTSGTPGQAVAGGGGGAAGAGTEAGPGEGLELGSLGATWGSLSQSMGAAGVSSLGGTWPGPRSNSAPQSSAMPMHPLASTHNSFGAGGTRNNSPSRGYSFADTATTPGGGSFAGTAGSGVVPKGSGLKGASLAGTLVAYSTRPGGILDVFAAARDGQV
ncbi:unnamed protein product, partial [Laminaria digitata]